MAEFSFINGLDLPIAGEASGDVFDLPIPATVAYAPTEFRGLNPRLLVREGARVKAGASLFHHKSDPRIVFRSPAAGTVQEVRRGARRQYIYIYIYLYNPSRVYILYIYIQLASVGMVFACLRPIASSRRDRNYNLYYIYHR